jgi:ribose/xylose/arabinose/galactoside ABC-type transport system permease subunit
VYLFFVGLAPWSFSTVANIRVMALDSVFTAVAALGAVLVMAAGGMDLSAGAAMQLGAAVSVWAACRGGMNEAVAVLGGTAAAGVVGFVNGCLASRLGVTPVAVTLGTMLLASGAAALVPADAGPTAAVSASSRAAGSAGPWSWPLITGCAAAMAAAVEILLRCTVPGRHIRAAGSNESAARLCGVRVDELKILVYTLGGIFAGIAGVMHAHAPALANRGPNAGVLEIVAAAAIGGARLSGGRGSAAGAVVGAMIMTVIRTGCAQMGAPEPVRNMVAGMVVLSVIGLDQFRRRRDLLD